MTISKRTRRRAGVVLSALLVPGLAGFSPTLAHAQAPAANPPAAAPAPAAPAAPAVVPGAPAAPANPAATTDKTSGANEAGPIPDAAPAVPAGETPPLEPAAPGVPPTPLTPTEEATLGAEPYFNPDEMDVIKVTVDRREKRIQDYAGSATAFSEDDMTRVGVNSVREIATKTPFVEMGTQEGNTEIYIRGVGSNNNTELGDPATAVHVDGIYIPRPRGVGSMFFDIERIEINRGPQGTLRGRNATAGSVNLVTAKPRLKEWMAEASQMVGNYSQRISKAMVNIPIAQIAALRFAVFSDNREPFYKNAGPIYTITPPESADTLSYRMSGKLQPTSRVTLLLSHDYTQEKGTGYTGSNYQAPLRAGLQPNEVPDPRAVIYRGPQPSQNMKHWGVHGNLNIDLGPVMVEATGAYRDLDYRQVTGGNAGVVFPGMEAPALRDLDNWSSSYWHTTSKATITELRLFAPDASRFRWTAGGFFMNEKQTAFLGSTNDQSDGYVGNEFNMPSVKGRSLAGFLDAVVDITQSLRAHAGARVTGENKERTGIGNVYGFWGVPSFRFGTEGFKWAEGGRTLWPSFGANGYAWPQGATPLQILNAGISQYGVRDTMYPTLSGLPLDGTANGSWSTLQPQYGTYNETFFDFRVGADANITKDHLVYVKFDTGTHSGGFNDSFPDQRPGTTGQPFSQTYRPEKLYATEIGSKNEFLDRKLRANVSAFWYEYRDMQFQTIAPVPGAQADPNTGNIASTAMRLNIGKARILGLEAEGTWHLPFGLVAGVQALFLDARGVEGNVDDSRLSWDLAARYNVNLKDKRLPRSPRVAVSYSLAQNISTPIGWFDWIISGMTKSKQYMTIFNGEGFDTAGNPQPRLNDAVPSYTRFDAGIGYTRPDGKTRLDAFVSNLSNATYVTTLINTPDLNLRFFNPPRQVGVRMTLFW